MERRRAHRIKQRLTCEIVLGERRHPGIVLDVSETGLFVQTSAAPPPGERARVTLRCPDGADVEVEGCVARRYVIPRRLVSVVRGGVGLKIDDPSEAFLRLVDSVTRKENSRPQPAKTPSPESGQGSAYRVRVKQTSGPRTRSFRITAASDEEARVAVAAKVEEGWELLDVEPIQR